MVADSIAYDQRALRLVFDLRDQQNAGATIRVTYDGPKPDAFEPGINVLAQGTYSRGDNLFTADDLLVKCPSKYESKESTTEGERVGSLR